MDLGERASLALFAVTDDDTPRVLLIKRRDHPYIDHWALPGGIPEGGERAEDAMRREFTKETGIDAPDGIIQVGAYHHPEPDPRGRVMSIAYAAVIPRIVRARAISDPRAVAWMPLVTALGNTRMAFDHARILTDAALACGLSTTS